MRTSVLELQEFKEVVTPDNSLLLHELLTSYNISASAGQIELLLAHLALVLHKNKVMNLTRIQGVSEALVLHILDSLLFLPDVEKTEGKLLDIGTGAGYPGIPLVVMTKRPSVLMDSVKKKTAAVDEFISELGLSELVSTTSSRAETYALTHKREFGAVVARAVAPLGVLLEYAEPLLAPGGSLIVSKGVPQKDELTTMNRVAKFLGYAVSSKSCCELPHGMGFRTLFAFKKVEKPKMRLPRVNGLARSKPL